MQKLPANLYTAKQVRALDQIVIKDHGIPGIELMSRAGNAVFRQLKIRWPKAQSIAVFCGSGNNGGDGYIVATLAQAVGLKVTVFALSNPASLPDNAQIAYQDFIAAKGVVSRFDPGQEIKADVIVDAMLGTGLGKPVVDNYAIAIQAINKGKANVIAVDVPSGLDSDTGNVMGYAVKADCTVTFIGLKQGLFTGMAADYCGEIVYESLAVPNTAFKRINTTTTLINKKNFPPRLRCSHKGDHGHVLAVGGDKGFTGAVRLASEAALRVGSGLVSVATNPEHAPFLNNGRPELMCHGVGDASELLPLLEKATVILIGPGLGQGKWAAELFIAALKSGKTMVVDADALNLLALVSEQQPRWVLTPHPGEATRLLACTTAEVQQDRFATATAIQEKYGGVAVLKGAGTIIASQDELAVSTTGNPGMASGGMGDVLAGVIAGLIAQGFSQKDAAQQGVCIHGMAADMAAEQGGERGLLASDLMPYLRRLVN